MLSPVVYSFDGPFCLGTTNAFRSSLMWVGFVGICKPGGAGIRADSFIVITLAINLRSEIHFVTSRAFSRESGDNDRSPDGSLIMWAILFLRGSSLL